ncbi:MAG TPA: AbrB/MazE/SpoVT family DNA-binding domain-containing protein [Candidatus Nanoarchaeia archaeon]|nr:AbrB/MazE/SpoVT family DNA-binding domain-containing protein [Candidatus Nanoarchaeia archaeon]
MMEVEAKVRKWGRSFGVVIPKDKIMKEGIKENDTINLLIGKKSNVLRETFGTMKFKKSTEEMMKETDRELWGEE